MNWCIYCKAPCTCGRPVIAGKHATYDPDMGGWVTWRKWRAITKRAALVNTHNGKNEFGQTPLWKVR